MLQEGCEYGRILNNNFNNEKEYIRSKVISVEHSQELFFKDIFPDIQKNNKEAIQLAKEAKAISIKTEKNINSLIWAILGGMLLLVATNLFNQFWTSNKMDKLYNILEYRIEKAIRHVG